jgi:hypothetical protein
MTHFGDRPIDISIYLIAMRLIFIILKHLENIHLIVHD